MEKAKSVDMAALLGAVDSFNDLCKAFEEETEEIRAKKRNEIKELQDAVFEALTPMSEIVKNMYCGDVVIPPFVEMDEHIWNGAVIRRPFGIEIESYSRRHGTAYSYYSILQDGSRNFIAWQYQNNTVIQNNQWRTDIEYRRWLEAILTHLPFIQTEFTDAIHRKMEERARELDKQRREITGEEN